MGNINKKLHIRSQNRNHLFKKFSIATIFEKIQEDFLFNPEIKEISKMDKDPNTPMRGIPVPGRQVPGLTTSTPARTSTIPLIMQLNDSDSDDEEDDDDEEGDGEEESGEDEEGEEESGEDEEGEEDEDDEEGEGEEDSDDDEEGEEEEDEDEEEEEDKKAKGEVKRKTIMPQLTLKKLPKKTDLNSCIKPCI